MLASSYPFADVLWTMLVFFLWVMWFWLLFGVFADIFRRQDISGWTKTAWLIFTICLPFLGVFVYLISQNTGMTERANAAAASRATVGGGGAAAEIDRGKQLLDTGTITQAEFDTLKAKALAA